MTKKERPSVPHSLTGLLSIVELRNREKSIQKFIKYTNDKSEHECLDTDTETKPSITDEEARTIIKMVSNLRNVSLTLF